MRAPQRSHVQTLKRNPRDHWCADDIGQLPPTTLSGTCHMVYRSTATVDGGLLGTSRDYVDGTDSSGSRLISTFKSLPGVK